MYHSYSTYCRFCFWSMKFEIWNFYGDMMIKAILNHVTKLLLNVLYRHIEICSSFIAVYFTYNHEFEYVHCIQFLTQYWISSEQQLPIIWRQCRVSELHHCGKRSSRGMIHVHGVTTFNDNTRSPTVGAALSAGQHDDNCSSHTQRYLNRCVEIAIGKIY